MSCIITTIRRVAKVHGWAIGTHGSLVRDIDLIGVPWTADASTPDVLVLAIAKRTGYTTHGHTLGPPRSGGRRSILLMHPKATFKQTKKGTWTPPAIDLSLMPSPMHCLMFFNGQTHDKPASPAKEQGNV